MTNLNNKTIIITGASRGIGREMALKFAEQGANLVIAAKTSEPNPKLPGTIHSVAEEVVRAGGRAIAVQVDVRDEASVEHMIQAAVDEFGGIDVIINNAGAIALAGVESTPLKKFDLMMQVNFRATFLCAQKALPYLKKSENPHILSLSPPIDMDPRWLRNHSPYTLTKYGMSILTMGMSDEFKRYGISVNALWPRTVIATSAISFGGQQAINGARTPAIMADAASEILNTGNREITGQLIIDEEFLRERGTTDFDQYRANPDKLDAPLMPDLFVQDEEAYVTGKQPPLKGL
ncbi:NAD(P)-dependent oxidoreductase [Litoribacillus peritrichatus]|uniref:NAD(P)-dependent oxidoreductase n=1 Tax=Litoribacillus peritrichatus TaxID=718191 RepID=A0ABP7MBA9_9GAMM